VAVAAVNVNVAVAVPVLVPAAVNVVVPHPLTDNAPKLPSPNVGNTSAIVCAAFIGTFKANVNTSVDIAAVTGVPSTRDVRWNPGVGCTNAVDTAIAVDDAMSLADASVTPTVLVLRLAACASALVVTPVPTVTVHRDPAASVAVAAVSVSVAVAVYELALDAVNVVVPHPEDTEGVPSVPIVNPGSTNAIVSNTVIGAFSVNLYDTGDCENV